MRSLRAASALRWAKSRFPGGGDRVGAVARPRHGLGENERRAFGLGEVGRFPPCRHREPPHIRLARAPAVRLRAVFGFTIARGRIAAVDLVADAGASADTTSPSSAIDRSFVTGIPSHAIAPSRAPRRVFRDEPLRPRTAKGANPAPCSMTVPGFGPQRYMLGAGGPAQPGGAASPFGRGAIRPRKASALLAMIRHTGDAYPDA